MNQQTDLTYDRTFELDALRPTSRTDNPAPKSAPACELMFFCGAPFAHVVRYEDHIRTKRKDHESRVLLRNQPPRRWRGFEDMLIPPLADGYVRETNAG
ncbi:hypothetical protein GRI75_02885 [Altererythrobacter soli]|uniref:Uncharacterized protein n=1 Tax=Croceibacterium soli TaxID=1739690 RepID=A0A6I4USL6_9SPHN|nr:hypothetical protein [Croceibacterium soli]MXP40593.1 hypothetical protein [Croceibacterium soli]